MQTLANELNISRATVSYVLAGRARENKIPPATEKRILEAARRHNFVPNYWARNLANSGGSGVGLLFPDAQFSSTQELIMGAQSVLLQAGGERAGHGSFLAITGWNPAREREELNALLSKRIAGLICLPTESNAPAYMALRKKRFPMVYVTDKLAGDDEFFVMIDGADAVNKIFDHFESLGHRHIAVIGPDGTSTTIRERYATARVRLERLGLDPDRELVLGITGQEETIYDAVDRTLARENRPTAILGIDDSVAYQTMHQLLTRGLTPGKDIALAGIGDMAISKYRMVGLTTVQERRYEFGQIATHLLLDQINGKSTGTTGLRIKGELIVRSSSGGAAR